VGSPLEEARIRLPQLRRDELLEELQARLDAVRGTRDRVDSLPEAVLSVGREPMCVAPGMAQGREGRHPLLADPDCAVRGTS
jgi:hypothetical protein